MSVDHDSHHNWIWLFLIIAEAVCFLAGILCFEDHSGILLRKTGTSAILCKKFYSKIGLFFWPRILPKRIILLSAKCKTTTGKVKTDVLTVFYFLQSEFFILKTTAEFCYEKQITSAMYFVQKVLL